MPFTEVFTFGQLCIQESLVTFNCGIIFHTFPKSLPPHLFPGCLNQENRN